jgi:hypothetical protein
MADEEREALRRLEQRLDQASETAQRLMAEAAQAAQGQKPPAAGWQSQDNGQSTRSAGAELDALISAVRSLRELIPAEVLQRLAEALKEVLLAIRALIDWYIERLERPRTEPPEVEDIPIQ